MGLALGKGTNLKKINIHKIISVTLDHNYMILVPFDSFNRDESNSTKIM